MLSNKEYMRLWKEASKTMYRQEEAAVGDYCKGPVGAAVYCALGCVLLEAGLTYSEMSHITQDDVYGIAGLEPSEQDLLSRINDTYSTETRYIAEEMMNIASMKWSKRDDQV
jgi:hypothetical protein